MDRTLSPPERSRRLIGFTFLLLTILTTSLYAQYQTGNIYGTVTDSSGAALPGVTVSLSGVGAPQVFTTGDDGKFRFLSLSPGRYSVTAELAGLGSAAREGLEVNVGANTTIALALSPTVEQTITVTAETPLIDVRKTGTGATVTRIELEQIPSARDPWVVLQQVPGVLVDRINVGGNESGQQSSYVGKGASGDQATWNVDGVNITDMAATGSSPTYYDFDSFEEMQATTGGSDPRIMTPGVQLNMVTKRGTNEFMGSGRYFVTDNSWQAEATVPDEAQTYLGRANEIDHIDDMGLEVGGPIVKDRLWIWGAYSENQIDLLTAAAPDTVGSFDKTTLENWNAKLNGQLTSNNSATFLFTKGDKIKLGRDVGIFRPPETAHNQDGPTELYKLEDTHIFGPSFFVTGLASKVDSSLVFAPAGGMDIDVWFDPEFVAHRSYYEYSSDRPQDNYRLDASSFFNTGALSHELKFGFGYRDTPTESATAWPGSGNYAQFFDENFGLAYLTRPGAAVYGTDYTDFYAGDTMLWNNLTVNFGLRFDMQRGSNKASTVPANQLVPDLLPESSYAGDAEELEWNSISPRLGATYSFGETRRTLIRGAYNRYVDQLSASVVSPGHPFYTTQGLLYYFDDLNGDRSVQLDEILFDQGLYSWYGLDPDNPGVVLEPVGRLDYDMDPPKTDEFILGFEHELLPEFTIGANYTHRIFSDFLWTVFEKEQFSNDFYSPADYQLEGTVEGTLPNGEHYSQPYYSLREDVDVGVFKVTTNRPDYEQAYNGFELNATKRLSNRWMMRANVSVNDWKQKVGENGFVDPTSSLSTVGCSNCDDSIVVYGSGTGSGAKGGVYINSRWSYNVTGLYELPWQVMLGAAVTGREGYPIPYYHRAATPRGEGTKLVLVDGVDGGRNEDIMNLDLRLAKEFKFGDAVGLTVSADMFNVTDERTVLQRQHRLATGEDVNTAANRILELQSPRVFRLGARVSF